MKANNLLYIIRWGNEKQQLKLIYALACVSLIAMMIVYRPSTFYDTPSYYEAGEHYLNGNIDAFRTPVFSIICGLAQRMGVFNHPFIVALHLVFYLISMRYFYKTCEIFLENKVLKFITATLYATLPSFSGFTLCILTESLSLSLFIIFGYYSFAYISQHNLRASVISNVLLVVLLLLRPSFIFVVPISLIITIFIAYKKTHHAIVHCTGVILALSIFCCYCMGYKSVHGVFSSSCVNNVNQIVMMYKDSLLDDNAMKIIMQSKRKPTTEVSFYQFLLDNTTPLQKKVIADQLMEKHGKEYLVRSLSNLLYMTSIHTQSIYTRPRMPHCNLFIYYFSEALSLSVGMVYVLLLIYAVIFFQQSRQKEVPVGNIFAWLIIAGNLFTAIVGAQGEYSRLILPCTPFILLLLTELIDKLNISKKNDIKFV